jgi:DNA repair protein RadA/Sms
VARAASRYACSACGAIFLRWEGQCRGCGAWNTLVETVVERTPRTRGRTAGTSTPAAPEPLGAGVETVLPGRWSSGLAEFDRVLGGGLVPGAVVLVGGEPGIGKSTLVLQAAAGLVGIGERRLLVVSGEESTSQIRLRAARLGLAGGPAGQAIEVVSESSVDRIVELAEAAAPDALVVDSIQTVTIEASDGPAGSVGQIREATLRFIEWAKGSDRPVLLIGHVTKDGALAGPKALEHLVDVVLVLEGERSSGLRLLRAQKNRFGPTDEIGVFEMAEVGLREVADPGRTFLVEHPEPAPGAIVAPTLEGSRPILVEVQALVAPASGYGPPRRTVSGLDPNRLALLLAVLARRAGIGLGGHDVYASLAGGMAVTEPAVDLPLAIALASSLRDRPVAAGTVAVGEVGLLGELRPVGGLERRLREAARLGFDRAVVPAAGEQPAAGGRIAGLSIVAVRTLAEALAAVLGGIRAGSRTPQGGPGPVPVGRDEEPFDRSAHDVPLGGGGRLSGRGGRASTGRTGRPSGRGDIG